MSCFVMTPAATRQMGHTLENILNQYVWSNTIMIPWYAVERSKIIRVFDDCRDNHGYFDGEKLSGELWRLNVEAFNGRYKETGGENLPPEQYGLPDLRKTYSLVKAPKYGEHKEIPQEWHYHLCKLLDCWLYQTAEDSTYKDEKRLCIKKFSDSLKITLVQRDEKYSKFEWGR